MVSLENSRNAKGGFSFEPTSPSPINEEFNDSITQLNGTNNDGLPLTTDVEPNFKQIKTTYVICLQILTLVLLIISIFLIPYFCGDNNEKCPILGSADLIVIIHAAMWLIKFCFDRFYHHHHMKNRRNGYLKFYRMTRFLRSVPLVVISASNSILVVLIKLIAKYCPIKCTTVDLEPHIIIQIFISIECAILLPILIYYLVLTINFNRSKNSPDINIEIDKPSSFNGSQLKDIGFKDSSYVKNILENQADMIRYLQERNEKLSQKLFQLSQKTNIN